jgi:hypothetical protein
MCQMRELNRLAKLDFSQILACTPFFMPCSHMLHLTLVIVPVTVRAGRDVAACAARLGAQRVCSSLGGPMLTSVDKC